jgi:hypothetical protein
VKVLKNSTQIWPASGWYTIAYNDGTGVPHNIYTTATAGDVIRFIANRNGGYACDSMFWDINATPPWW